MIEIDIESLQQANVIRLVGEIDAASAPVVQQKVLPLSIPGCKLFIDMSKVAYMSSAGLRMLLSVYRQISGNQGRVILLGLSDDLKDTMSMTGFLDYFLTCDTLEAGLLLLNQ